MSNVETGGQAFTVDSINPADPGKTIVSPEFMRLPKSGQRDPIFGLSRSHLNYLVLPSKDNGFRPLVKSSVLRRRGARTGVRLISVASLRSYIQANQVNCGISKD